MDSLPEFKFAMKEMIKWCKFIIFSIILAGGVFLLTSCQSFEKNFDYTLGEGEIIKCEVCTERQPCPWIAGDYIQWMVCVDGELEAIEVEYQKAIPFEEGPGELEFLKMD